MSIELGPKVIELNDVRITWMPKMKANEYLVMISFFFIMSFVVLMTYLTMKISKLRNLIRY